MGISKCRDQRFWKRWRESGAIGTLTVNPQKHPELRPGEVFLRNVPFSERGYIPWESKRFGSVALDSLGRPMSNDEYSLVPVFANADELSAKGLFIKHEPKAVRYYPPF